MTVGGSKAEPMITRQPALAPSPQPRPAPTARPLIAQNDGQGGPFWMPIRGPVRTPIDTETLEFCILRPRQHIWSSVGCACAAFSWQSPNRGAGPDLLTKAA